MNIIDKLKKIKVQDSDSSDTIAEAIENIKEYQNYIIDLEHKLEGLYQHSVNLTKSLKKLSYGSRDGDPFLKDYLGVDLSYYIRKYSPDNTIKIKSRPLAKFKDLFE